MEPPPQARVLRCCSCHLFQAHQVKKSPRWTCKACGEKQSFLRTYGEGSGADCRRHVQKLNLLQGQVSEMPLRSLEEPVSADKERNAGPGLTEHVSVQSHAGLAGKVREGSGGEDRDARERLGPAGDTPSAAQPARPTSSKWEQFLLPPANSPHVDTEPWTPLQKDPKPAGAAQASTPRAHAARDEGLSRTVGALLLPWAIRSPTGGLKRTFRETPEQLCDTGPQAEGWPSVRGAQKPRLTQLCDLFNTGEDFDDIL